MLRFATQNFLPAIGHDIQLVPGHRHRKRRRRRVANRQPFAVIGNPVGMRHDHARSRPIPGKDDIMREIGLGQIGKLAKFGDKAARFQRLELFQTIRDPVLAKAFPRENIDRTHAQKRPQSGFDRACIAGCHNAHQIIRREFEQGFGFIDGAL